MSFIRFGSVGSSFSLQKTFLRLHSKTALVIKYTFNWYLDPFVDKTKQILVSKFKKPMMGRKNDSSTLLKYNFEELEFYHFLLLYTSTPVARSLHKLHVAFMASYQAK